MPNYTDIDGTFVWTGDGPEPNIGETKAEYTSRTGVIVQPSGAVGTPKDPTANNLSQVGWFSDTWDWFDRRYFGGWLPGGSTGPSIPGTDIQIPDLGKLIPLIILMTMGRRGGNWSTIPLMLLLLQGGFNLNSQQNPPEFGEGVNL